MPLTPHTKLADNSNSIASSLRWSRNVTVAGIITKDPDLALIMLGSQTSATAYGDARRAGADKDKANRYAVAMGLVEGLTERMPMHYLIGDISKKTPFAEALTKQLIADGLGEQAATHVQDLLTWLELNPDATFADYMKERPEALSRTAVSSAMMSMVFAGGGRALGALAPKTDAQSEQSPDNSSQQPTTEPATPVAEATPEAAQAQEQTARPRTASEAQPAQTKPETQQEATQAREKLAEVEAISNAVQMAEAQQPSPEDQRTEVFLATYEALLGPDAVIEDDFKDVVAAQPALPPEGTIGRGMESLVEEQQAANPPVPEAQQEDTARPQETSFRSYFGRKSFRQQNALEAPPTTEERIALQEAVATIEAASNPVPPRSRPSAPIGKAELDRIARHEGESVPEVAAAEDMLATAESVYDQVLSKEMLRALDDQFSIPAERVRDIMDKAIEGQGSLKTFNALMKRVNKVQRSGVRYGRDQGISVRRR